MIYSNKYDTMIDSNIDPNEFKEAEKQSQDIHELTTLANG